MYHLHSTTNTDWMNRSSVLLDSFFLVLVAGDPVLCYACDVLSGIGSGMILYSIILYDFYINERYEYYRIANLDFQHYDNLTRD